jgi:dolichol-phosphate mannosyltransferase
MRACIILPTYNEAGNIISILDRIRAQDSRLMVLVVDDGSPDGTAQLALAYGKKHPHVHVLQRTAKEGLGAAYIAGMRYALREFRPDVILEMDADGSHNPADILRLINAIEKGADFAIGSRYVPGGTVPAQWGFYRKFNSAAGNWLVRNVLSLKKVKDCTGGFRAIRASSLEQVDFIQLHAKGYGFQISLLYAMMLQGASIVEIPIHFSDRTIGVSKMRFKDQIEFITLTFRLRALHAVSSSERTGVRTRVAASRKL